MSDTTEINWRDPVVELPEIFRPVLGADRMGCFYKVSFDGEHWNDWEAPCSWPLEHIHVWAYMPKTIHQGGGDD